MQNAPLVGGALRVTTGQEVPPSVLDPTDDTPDFGERHPDPCLLCGRPTDPGFVDLCARCARVIGGAR
jgi:hypothetical protein